MRRSGREGVGLVLGVRGACSARFAYFGDAPVGSYSGNRSTRDRVFRNRGSASLGGEGVEEQVENRCTFLRERTRKAGDHALVPGRSAALTDSACPSWWRAWLRLAGSVGTRSWSGSDRSLRRSSRGRSRWRWAGLQQPLASIGWCSRRVVGGVARDRWRSSEAERSQQQ